MKLGASHNNITRTGQNFEDKVNIIDLLNKKNINIEQETNFSWNIVNIGKILVKTGLYSWFKDNENTKKVFIIEVKYQQVHGSVDEKLQTCEFKLLQYKKIFDTLGYKTEFAYVLNDWFKSKFYKDVLDFILLKKCHYFFNEIDEQFIFN